MRPEHPQTSYATEDFLEILSHLKGHLLFLQEMGLEDLPRPRARNPQLISDQPDQPASALHSIREEIGDCRRCKLHSSRTQIVFGAGNPLATLVFVGEAPGQDEDRQGLPFVGKAGQLLTRMIAAMGFTREEVYIANIVKCRPPNNRNPEPDEIAACEPFLKKQLGVVQPQIICALGNFAAQTLLRTQAKISQLRGRFHDYLGIRVMPTFHPAYLLRNPQDKRLVWEDLQKIMAELRKTRPSRENETL